MVLLLRLLPAGSNMFAQYHSLRVAHAWSNVDFCSERHGQHWPRHGPWDAWAWAAHKTKFGQHVATRRLVHVQQPIYTSESATFDSLQSIRK